MAINLHWLTYGTTKRGAIHMKEVKATVDPDSVEKEINL